MKLASWNVNGLRAIAKKGELASFIKSEQPDLVCLQEVKLRPEQADLAIENYQLLLNCAKRPGYSGTGMLIHNRLAKSVSLTRIRRNLPPEIAQEFTMSTSPFGDPNDEGRVLAIELPDYYVVTVYTPNAKEDLSRLELRFTQWDPAFLAYLNQLRRDKPVIFCGDLNVAAREIDLANPKQNQGKHGFTDQERQGFSNFIQAGFTDSFRKINGDVSGQYTWWSYWARSRERNIGWRIDYYLVDDRIQTRINQATIYSDQLGSDHCPIGLTMS